MALLVRTPRPGATESLHGFVLRVSESNGYDTPWHVFQIAGIGQGQMFSGGMPVEKLAAVLGMGAADLAHLSHAERRGGRLSYKLLGQSLGNSPGEAYLRTRQAVFCPACVQTQGYIDAACSLTVTSACPVHRCWLIKRCPACSVPLSWFRPGLLTCRCGADLANVKTEAVGENAAGFMQVLRSKVHGKSIVSEANPCGFPLEHMEGLSLHRLVRLAMILGRHHLLNDGVTSTEDEETFLAAAQVLHQWPRGYHQFLQSAGERFRREGVAGSGMRKQFEPLYDSLFKGRTQAEDAMFLREEFVNFGALHWGFAVVDDKLLGPSRTRGARFVSKTEFMRRHQISAPALDRLIAEGEVSTRSFSGDRTTRTVVDLVQTSSIGSRKDIITDREAAAKVGLPVSVLQQLRGRGVFETRPRAGHRTSWHMEDVDNFIVKGFSLIQSKTEGLVTILVGEVMRMKLRSAALKAEVVAAAFGGRIDVVGLQGETLSDLLLYKWQVDGLLHDELSKRTDEHMSVSAAAKMTGLDCAVVASAVEHGLLVASEVGGVRQIRAASVRSFSNLFVSLATLSKRFGSHSRWMKTWCDEREIKLVELSRGPGAPAQHLLQKFDESAVCRAWHELRQVKRGQLLESRQRKQLDAVTKYLDTLREQGTPLPRRAGKPNKAVIARACGIGRDVFYTLTRAVELLDAYALEESNSRVDPLQSLDSVEEDLKD